MDEGGADDVGYMKPDRPELPHFTAYPNRHQKFCALQERQVQESRTAARHLEDEMGLDRPLMLRLHSLRPVRMSLMGS